MDLEEIARTFADEHGLSQAPYKNCQTTGLLGGSDFLHYSYTREPDRSEELCVEWPSTTSPPPYKRKLLVSDMPGVRPRVVTIEVSAEHLGAYIRLLRGSARSTMHTIANGLERARSSPKAMATTQLFDVSDDTLARLLTLTFAATVPVPYA